MVMWDVIFQDVTPLLTEPPCNNFGKSSYKFWRRYIQTSKKEKLYITSNCIVLICQQHLRSLVRIDLVFFLPRLGCATSCLIWTNVLVIESPTPNQCMSTFHENLIQIPTLKFYMTCGQLMQYNIMFWMITWEHMRHWLIDVEIKTWFVKCFGCLWSSPSPQTHTRKATLFHTIVYRVEEISINQ